MNPGPFLLASLLLTDAPPTASPAPSDAPAGASGTSVDEPPAEERDAAADDVSGADATGPDATADSATSGEEDAAAAVPENTPAEEPATPSGGGQGAAGDEGLGDFFAGDDGGEAMPAADEPAASSGGAEGPRRHAAKLLDGKLTLRLRAASSVYMDIDNYYEGERWSADYDGAGTFSRNENRLEFYFAYAPNEHIQIVGDIEPVFMGVSQAATLDDLASQQMLTPFHLESDAAYVAITDLVPGVDVKVGRQIVVWGTADKFNPTNNLNPDDLEDRPLFTEPIANQMVVIDVNPWSDKLWLQTVYIPLFYPALLPPSATAALADPQSPVPYSRQEDLDAIAFLQSYVENDPRYEPEIFTRVVQPAAKIRHGQAGARLGSSIGGFDLSASYFYGFHDIPSPSRAVSTLKCPLNFNPPDPENCPLGPDDVAPPGYHFRSDVTLIYPRMHVIGADFATQIPFLDDMGLWGEMGLFLPEKQYDFTIELPRSLDVTSGRWDDGVAATVDEVSGPVAPKKVFTKATVGADYTIGKHVYVQAQYLRGFIDDFGVGNIGNYLVAGGELIFFGRNIVFRMFAVTDFPKDKSDRASLALAPNLILVPPWGFITFELGGFGLVGRQDTKFGQAATGSSILHFKVAGAF